MTENNERDNSPDKSAVNPAQEETRNDDQNSSGYKVAFIRVGQDTALAVDEATGEIKGENAEGTLGIVLYGGDPKYISGERFEAQKAIRLPRLLQSDVLLNFHVAEISFHESRQAANFAGATGILGANNFYRFEFPNSYTNIPETSDPCFIGFYFSPTSAYQLCLVSNNKMWPKDFSDYVIGRMKNADGEKSADGEKYAKKLFENIMRLRDLSDANVFSKLLFLPDRRDQVEEVAGEKSLLSVVSRDTLAADYEKREIKGWWFNIPVAIYPWMSANLERLLTGYVDEDDTPNKNKGSSLKNWNLYKWVELLRQLSLGLKRLHSEGAIHGDPRPANIMTDNKDNTPMDPESFRWIDIGLGYGARDVIRDTALADEATSITPRPLGGGRSTIFYAPEREEAKEFEDADAVSLVEVDSDKNLSELTFYWRERTQLSASVLPLLSGKVPLRELGKLKKGDRVQVREFLFEVEEVKPNSLIVSRIYEIFLDRVLVEKRAGQRETVHKRLREASISRYRIFQQWSQATDIYGLGMITLYIFFIRGIRALKIASRHKEEGTDSKSSIYDRANREAIFNELAILLRNRSFLENTLYQFRNNGLANHDALQDALQTENSEVAKKVTEAIHASDANFEFVWRGLNMRDELFVQLIYFCLCCVWRQDEIEEIVERQNFPFKPFSESRLMIESEEERSVPSADAYRALERIGNRIDATEVAKDDEIQDSRSPRAIGVDRQQQMMTLREDLKDKEERVKELENQRGILERSLYQTAEGNKQMFSQVRMTASAITQRIDSNKTMLLLRGENKTVVASQIKQLIDLADAGLRLNQNAQPKPE